jgi:hypothetical protein
MVRAQDPGERTFPPCAALPQESCESAVHIWIVAEFKRCSPPASKCYSSPFRAIFRSAAAPGSKPAPTLRPRQSSKASSVRLFPPEGGAVCLDMVKAKPAIASRYGWGFIMSEENFVDQ